MYGISGGINGAFFGIKSLKQQSWIVETAVEI